MSDGSLDGDTGAPPMDEFPKIDIEQVMSGKFDPSILPAEMRSVIELPGFNLLRLMQLFGAMSAPTPQSNPWLLFPSFDWMVEDPGDPSNLELFTGTLLPLPQLSANGDLKLSRSALESSLDPDLYKWLVDSPVQDPVVYIAFGTIVKGNWQYCEKLIDALDKGPWRVLWSLPKDLHASLPVGLDKDRWHVKEFVPQMDVLRCEHVKCFISHCGHNSTTEAMACGVPMVCHPFFLDQFEWARTVRKHLHAGVQVDKFDSGPEAIRAAVREVLMRPAYAENAQKVAKRMQEHSAHLASSYGPAMAPKAPAGPGATVVAGLVLAFMRGGKWEESAARLQELGGLM